MTNPISDDYYLPATSKVKVTTQSDNSALGKDAFLKLLITQLQNQDPTSPMDDKEFIAQMAQFSSLEQMQNMTKAMESLLEAQHQTQMMSYTNFIGKEIKWDELTDKLDDKGDYIVNSGKGIITEMKFVKGEPIFVLEDGKEITPGNISSVLGGPSTNESTPTPSNPFAEASQIIGKPVQYSAQDQLIDSIIESITIKNGVIEYILSNGTRLTKNQFEVIQASEEIKADDPQAETDAQPAIDAE